MVNCISSLPVQSHFNSTVKNIGHFVDRLTVKVKALAIKIFSAIAAIVVFPFRYFGSKTWSIPGVICRLPIILFKKIIGCKSDLTFKEQLFGKGYNFGFEKELSPAEITPYAPGISASCFIHRTEDYWLNGNKYWSDTEGFKLVSPAALGVDSESVETRERCFFDPASGLKVAILEHSGKVYIPFGALFSSETEFKSDTAKSKVVNSKNKWQATFNLLGATPSLYRQADEFIEKLLKSPYFDGKEVVFTGHCLAGSLASYVALKQKKQALCINSFPLGAGLQREIGKGTLSDADKYVTHITVRGDWATDLKPLTFLDRIASACGLKTPGSFGKRLIVPQRDKSRFFNLDIAYKSHNYIHKILRSC